MTEKEAIIGPESRVPLGWIVGIGLSIVTGALSIVLSFAAFREAVQRDLEDVRDSVQDNLYGIREVGNKVADLKALVTDTVSTREMRSFLAALKAANPTLVIPQDLFTR